MTPEEKQLIMLRYEQKGYDCEAYKGFINIYRNGKLVLVHETHTGVLYDARGRVVKRS